jgi:O-antigen/teichoic acid export membrane protein
MAVLTLAEGAARGLSFGFYLLAAHVLLPSGFGVVQYTIALATVMLAPIQLLGLALRRELGADRADRPAEDATLGTGLALSLGALLLTLVLTGAAALLGLADTASAGGLLAVIAGLASFELYYAIARGRGEFRRAATAYAGGALLQLLVFTGVALASEPSPTAALCIYGASSIVPILAFEALSPMLRRRPLRIRRASARRAWITSRPLAAGVTAFLVWSSADQIWVGTTFGSADIGFYGAARNVAQVLMVPIVGFTGALMPRVAELRASGESERALALIRSTTWALLACCGAMAALLVAGRSLILEGLYGDAYGAGAPALVGLCVGMVLFAGFSGLGQGATGWGAPRVYAVGYLVAALVEVILLVGGDWAEPSAAAWISAAGVGAGWAAMIGYLRLRPLRARDELPPEPDPPGPLSAG